MAKKNMDILLGNILGSAAIKPQDRYEEPADPLPANDASTPSTKKTSKKASEDSWRHFSFICSKSLVDKDKPLLTRRVLLSVPLWSML